MIDFFSCWWVRVADSSRSSQLVYGPDVELVVCKKKQPLILKVTTKASIQSIEIRKLCIDDGIRLDQG